MDSQFVPIPFEDFVRAYQGRESFFAKHGERFLFLTTRLAGSAAAEVSDTTATSDALPAYALRLRPEEEVVVGRSPECELAIADPSVSGRHAVFLATESGMRLRDLGSRNGTFLDEVRLTEDENLTLPARAAIRLGTVSFRYLAGDEFWRFFDNMRDA